MKQIYHHFSKWEDYKNGFYDSSCKDKDLHITKAINLLSDENKFYNIATKLIKEWKYCCEHNLTDNSINRIAYIGQVSCCYFNNTPSFITKEAWWKIDESTRNKANNVAKRVLNEYLNTHLNKGGLWD